MRSAIPPLAVLLAASAALSACGAQQAPRPGRPSNTAVVAGTVRGPDGAPVAGAAVRITVVNVSAVPPREADRLRVGGCEGSPGPVATATTEADGSYRRVIDAGAGPEFEGCVAVEVQPPPASGLRAGSAGGGRVRFSSAAGGPLRVDVALAR